MDRSDDSLVADVQAGDSEAFDVLMRRYEKLVCRVALNYVRERQSALDVTQNVFLKAYRHIERVRAEGMFKPWLLRIAYNESISLLRRNIPAKQLLQICTQEWERSFPAHNHLRNDILKKVKSAFQMIEVQSRKSADSIRGYQQISKIISKGRRYE